MNNVDVEALRDTAERGERDPGALRIPLELHGELGVAGGPQFSGTIPYPGGEVEFAADFPPSLGGTGSAPNPLAYCFWGGLACYAMTFATEARLAGIELKALRGTVRADVDQSRMLGLSQRPPVESIEWRLEVDADASETDIARLKTLADGRCPGVYCVRNAIHLDTRIEQTTWR